MLQTLRNEGWNLCHFHSESGSVEKGISKGKIGVKLKNILIEE